MSDSNHDSVLEDPKPSTKILPETASTSSGGQCRSTRIAASGWIKQPFAILLSICYFLVKTHSIHSLHLLANWTTGHDCQRRSSHFLQHQHHDLCFWSHMLHHWNRITLMSWCMPIHWRSSWMLCHPCVLGGTIKASGLQATDTGRVTLLLWHAMSGACIGNAKASQSYATIKKLSALSTKGTPHQKRSCLSWGVSHGHQSLTTSSSQPVTCLIIIIT